MGVAEQAPQAQPNSHKDDDYERMDNREILTKQKEWMREQDGQIDEVTGVVRAIKYEAQDFNGEIKRQNK